MEKGGPRKAKSADDHKQGAEAEEQKPDTRQAETKSATKEDVPRDRTEVSESKERPHAKKSAEEEEEDEEEAADGPAHQKGCISLISAEDSVAWLHTHYEYHPGGLVQRDEMKDAFAAYCASLGQRPRQAAALGKIIKATFNEVSHRRLGKRGSNKMYYLHLRAKGESPEQETRPYTRRRRGEADDMSHLAGGNDTSGGGRNMVGLVCVLDGRNKGSQKPRAKRKQVDDDEIDNKDEVVRIDPPGAGRSSSSTSTPRARRGDASHLRFRDANVCMAFDSQVIWLRDMFRREYWALAPVNPASMKTRLIRSVLSDGDGEKSSLSFSCLVMLSLANFFAENWDYAMELFYKARRHLEAVFDQTDFDVACAISPFAWFSRFYSDSLLEGRETVLYYATLGATICQQLNACNDFAYFNLVSLMCAAKEAGEEEESVLVAKAKQQPPYRRNWKPFKQAMRPLRPTTATVHGELIQIDRLMYHSVSCLQNRQVSLQERLQIFDKLREQLDAVARLEALIEGARKTEPLPITTTYDMQTCLLSGQRALILSILEAPERLNAAERFVLDLVRVPRSAMLVALRSRPSNDVLLSNAFKVLIWHQRLEPLQQLVEILKPFSRRYMWLKTLRTVIKQSIRMGPIYPSWTASSPSIKEEVVSAPTSPPPALPSSSYSWSSSSSTPTAPGPSPAPPSYISYITNLGSALPPPPLIHDEMACFSSPSALPAAPRVHNCVEIPSSADLHSYLPSFGPAEPLPHSHDGRGDSLSWLQHDPYRLAYQVTSASPCIEPFVCEPSQHDPYLSHHWQHQPHHCYAPHDRLPHHGGTTFVYDRPPPPVRPLTSQPPAVPWGSVVPPSPLMTHLSPGAADRSSS